MIRFDRVRVVVLMPFSHLFGYMLVPTTVHMLSPVDTWTSLYSLYSSCCLYPFVACNLLLVNVLVNAIISLLQPTDAFRQTISN